MSIEKYDDLDSMQLDALREIGNIGSGNAATALSATIGMPVNIEVPNIKILDINDAVEALGGAEEIVAGILIKVEDGINGAMLSLQSLEVVNIMLNSLMGVKIEGFDQMDEMCISAVAEIGNIVMGSYINAIADMTGMAINMSVPGVSVNMVGGLVTVPMATYCYEADKIMMIECNFKFEGGEEYNNNLLLIPDVESLRRVLSRLGVYNE